MNIQPRTFRLDRVFDEKYLFERNGTGRDIDVQAQRDLTTI
jgi:predicted DNA-binding transcriptional regulator YafY